MKYTKKLVAYLLVNTLVLWLAHYFIPDSFVFGRGQIGYWQALVTTAAGLTLAVTLFDIIIYDFGIKLKHQEYIALETLVNIGTVYLFARTSLQNSIGVGIGAFWIAILVGLGISGIQYLVKRFVEHRLA